MKTSFRELAEICEKIESTTKRNLMVSIVSEFLQKLSLEEVEPAVSMILGRAFPKWDQRTLEVSWATLTSVIRKLTDIDWRMFIEAFNRTGDVGDATRIVLEKSRVKKQATLFEKTLTILEVRRNFEAIAEASGPGSREKKERLLEALLSNSSPVEAKYIVKILIGEMRTGFHEGLMELAVSKAFRIPHTLIQKAVMMRGDIGEVAYLAKKGGKDALTNISFRIFHPIKPMLAQMAENVEEALKEHRGKTAFEYKLDGARIQIHKLGDEVRIFSRRLTDVTASLPEIVEIVRKEVKAKEAILEGEVIAVNETGNPLPFQHLMRRFRRVHGIEDVSKRIPVKLYLFDLIYFDGQSLIDKPYVERRRKLAEISGKISLTKQTITDNVKDAQLFLEQAINAGHEGLVAKKLDSPYTPGVRGKKWFKIKKTLEPLDLVVVAAEYGYGRRHNWLSDYYLAARDEKTGEFLIVGKTFKGLTDKEIIEMTSRLKELAIKEEGRRVIVIPKIVVEVGYQEIQKSPNYESGYALRFPRLIRVRDDKGPEEADTIQRLVELYKSQGREG